MKKKSHLPTLESSSQNEIHGSSLVDSSELSSDSNPDDIHSFESIKNDGAPNLTENSSIDGKSSNQVPEKPLIVSLHEQNLPEETPAVEALLLSTSEDLREEVILLQQSQRTTTSAKQNTDKKISLRKGNRDQGDTNTHQGSSSSPLGGRISRLASFIRHNHSKPLIFEEQEHELTETIKKEKFNKHNNEYNKTVPLEQHLAPSFDSHQIPDRQQESSLNQQPSNPVKLDSLHDLELPEAASKESLDSKSSSNTCEQIPDEPPMDLLEMSENLTDIAREIQLNSSLKTNLTDTYEPVKEDLLIPHVETKKSLFTQDNLDNHNSQSSMEEPYQHRTHDFSPSIQGSIVSTQGAAYELCNKIDEEEERVIWNARDCWDGEKMYWLYEYSIFRYNHGFCTLPDLTHPSFQKPTDVISRADRVILVFNAPEGYCLSQIIDDPEVEWSFETVANFCREIAESIQEIHDLGYLFLQLSLDTLWIQPSGKPLITSVEHLYAAKTPFHQRPIIEGFSSPEAYNREQPIDQRSDLFGLGMLFHYMISRSRPFNHLHLPGAEIPSPRIWSLRCPIGIESFLRDFYHPKLTMRDDSIDCFVTKLEQFIRRCNKREISNHDGIRLDIGQDLHIGIRKGRRNPINQDALFWRYDQELAKGLFVLADGVSTCKYGSGDRASSLLIQVARKRWDTLLEKDIVQQSLSLQERHQVLQSLLDSGNKAIANDVNLQFPQIHGGLEDVMGTTCVAGFIDGNQISIANLGDSRAYLRSFDFFEQITVDHNFKTFRMQSAENMEAVSRLDNGNLLTRCVGSFQKDDEMKLVPLELQPDYFDFQLIPGDSLLFCSDGLTDYAGHNENEKNMAIRDIIDSNSDPLSTCFWLISLANQGGGGDNISMILLDVHRS